MDRFPGSRQEQIDHRHRAVEPATRKLGAHFAGDEIAMLKKIAERGADTAKLAAKRVRSMSLSSGIGPDGSSPP